MRLIAAWSDQDFEEGVEYELAGTACETVVGRGRAHYPARVQSLFPADALLQRCGAQGYFAESVFDRAGNALGHFGVISDKPLQIDPSWDRLFWLLQVRATGELTRRRQEERLSYLLHHDTLTGLPNRLLFLDRLNQALTRANWNHVLVSVMLCELDRFKLVSDALTPTVADHLLQSVTERLDACVRAGDTVARLGTKEFGLLLVDLASSDHISPIARKLLRAFSEPFLIDGQVITLGANIGVSVYPGDGEDAETVLRCAEAATFRAGGQGGSDYRFYTGAMNVKAAERLRLEQDLRRALEQHEFLLHYQPLVDLVSRRTTGFEALLRWQDPERGLVSPADFIPLLEETGLIVPVGEWVLRTACAEKETWRRAGLTIPRLSVNLSGRQLNDPDLIATVRRVIEETRIDPRTLELEITESTIQNAEVAAGILRDLSAMGLTLAIDDFGTGYSSLSYLKRLPGRHAQDRPVVRAGHHHRSQRRRDREGDHRHGAQPPDAGDRRRRRDAASSSRSSRPKRATRSRAICSAGPSRPARWARSCGESRRSPPPSLASPSPRPRRSRRAPAPSRRRSRSVGAARRSPGGRPWSGGAPRGHAGAARSGSRGC